VRFDVSFYIAPDWRLIGVYGAQIVANRFLRWTKSEASDVVGYQIRAKKDVDPTDTDPAFPVGDVDFVDLTTVPFLKDADGDYHFSVKSVDDVGLTSPHARIAGPLDFVPPAAPTGLRLTES
jgi:hypothetical protein